MEKEKVLIIKTGYSEFLEGHNNSRNVSLGDVLRTTPILHLFKKDEVTWLSDLKAFPLLEENPFIERLLPYDLTSILQIQSEEFDTLINLEKIPGICALADKINAWKKYGFRFNSRTGRAEAYDKAFEVLAVSADPAAKKENIRTAQELLFEMVGANWQGEEYVLGYKPKTQETFDVCLNTIIGQKWPTKAWPMENWELLEEKFVKDGLNVTRQDKQPVDILTNLNLYMDWINSGKIIISNDSLGLHLGIALQKKILGLFGPTPHKEVPFYNRGKAVYTENLLCMPCFKGECMLNKKCMDTISVEKVYKEAINLLNNSKNENNVYKFTSSV